MEQDVYTMDPSSIKARASRLKLLRQAIRISRRKLAEKYHIPAGTIQNWEDARYGGLSEKGARKLVEAFKAEGIPCKIEWLLYGVGANPVGPYDQLVSMNLSTPAGIGQTLNQQMIISKELELFHQHHPSAIDCIISSDEMAPLYQPGDVVAGCRKFSGEFEQLMNQHCIVQLKDGKVLVRYLEKGASNDELKLKSLKPGSMAEPINPSELFSAAAICWWRRPVLNT